MALENELTADKKLPSQPTGEAARNFEGCEKEGPMARVPLTLLTILLGAVAITVLDQLFAPALIDFLERATGKTASMEVVLRVHFLFVFFHILLIIFYLLFILPVKDFKKRLLLYCLAAESIVLCSIWVFDRFDHYFWSEESALTFCSAVLLLFCSFAALLNIFSVKIQDPENKVAIGFWKLLVAAFLFAGIDEFFMIHERVRLIIDANWANDLTTAIYAFGAIVFVLFFHKVVKNKVFEKGSYFFRLLVAGIIVFSSSVFLDSFDFIFTFLDRYVLTFNLLDSLEEILEFTAATLFFCAFVINLFETNGHRLLHLAIAADRPFAPGPLLKGSFWTLVILSFAISAGVKVAYSMEGESIIREKGYKVSVFADIGDGLHQPDGLIYSPSIGLILGNGHNASNILVFDSQGKARSFADATSGLISPEGFAIWQNALFVADDSQKKVWRYDAPGATPAIVTEEGLKSPDGLAIDPQGNLYLTDQKLSMVIRLSGTERQILATSLDGLRAPEEIALDEQGNLYVTDEVARAVFKITPEGQTSTLIDRSWGLKNPEGITYHRGQLYVTDSKAGAIFRLNPDGTGGKFLTFSKKYRGLSGIAFDELDRLYVVSADPYSINGYIFRIEPGR